MNITKNIGRIDRTIRFGIGLALVIWGLLSGNWLGLIGVILLATVALSWCPAYVPFGFSTRQPGE
jgi:hypothetical protein